MKDDYRLDLLRRAVVDTGSQAKAGRPLGYSAAVVNQALAGKYAGNLEAVLAKVEEVYGNRLVSCPVLGEIVITQCVIERRRPFSTASAMQVRLYRACRQCLNNSDN